MNQCEVDLVAEPLAQIRGQLDANVAASDDDHAHGRGTETARQERLAQLQRIVERVKWERMLPSARHTSIRNFGTECKDALVIWKLPRALISSGDGNQLAFPIESLHIALKKLYSTAVEHLFKHRGNFPTANTAGCKLVHHRKKSKSIMLINKRYSWLASPPVELRQLQRSIQATETAAKYTDVFSPKPLVCRHARARSPY
mmetsp:Transcript_30829/g.64949  ORF Transcript_30829/g.64949 Transcript_30829/m.64949 type:complete len:201 (+) Transcript_30829:381-983(+)